MPLGQSEQKIYLTIAYGKLRKKAKEGDPGAVWREFEGKGSWAHEYQWIEGTITKIYYKESKEYGNSYEVTIDDGKELYNISFKENSRYCQDFLVKLPNINLAHPVKINPYAMKDEQGNDKHGTSVQQNGEKLKNFFSQKEGEVWIYRHSFPEPKKPKLSDKEWKIYLIEIQCFLMDYVKLYIIPKLNDPTTKLGIDESESDVDCKTIENKDITNAPSEGDEDLPF